MKWLDCRGSPEACFQVLYGDMAHPFSIMFEKALAKSRGDENHVLGKAEELREKGYRPEEIFEVLVKLQKSLVADSDAAILAEAVEEFSQHIETEDAEG